MQGSILGPNLFSVHLIDLPAVPPGQHQCSLYIKYSKTRIYLYLITKKGHPLRVEDTYIWIALQGLSTETVYLRHSANTEGTILAGRSAASPKAPPYGSL